ncbi:hypothetical protein SAMN04487991_4222 [Celeribacter neptunius]|uniref:Uncharacterized protein n=1 Tax=Celeribacter neptunius TaxID=588602 RepID=A0A1I3Y078_9RHOB|nr:hypothetical protein SAMN04487991_4222 [Celeribacter neptunius]
MLVSITIFELLDRHDLHQTQVTQLRSLWAEPVQSLSYDGTELHDRLGLCHTLQKSFPESREQSLAPTEPTIEIPLEE